MAGVSIAELLAQQLEDDGDEQPLDNLSAAAARAFLDNWHNWARPEQLAPDGDWLIWLIMAGRGFGKTRAGAEWVHDIARNTPDARIALIGASLGEVRSVMVEGESGLLATAKSQEQILWEPSLRRLRWSSGAQAIAYSAGEPEALRGPQHSHGWCDEIAKWDIQNGLKNQNHGGDSLAQRSWSNLMMGLRLGIDQRVLATTTPRAVPLLKALLDRDDIAVTRGSTSDNQANLPDSFLASIHGQYGRSQLGRQELYGELIEDAEGALWTRDLIEKCRLQSIDNAFLQNYRRIVVAVDPPASATGDACGIIVVGLHENTMGHVLADASVEKASPEKWARAAAQAAQIWGADRVIAEANQGGAMVRSVLEAACVSLPVTLVHASRGKTARAEPVAALYEAGRVQHLGMFAQLEDEMCGLLMGGDYVGPGRSPDRANALVWALTELLLGRKGDPKIRMT